LSNIFAQIPTSGLVGYWPFSGNANDLSGNGANGLVNGAVLTTDKFGNANSAYYFNGIDNYIKCFADALPSTNRTVALWFYWDASILKASPLGYGGGPSCHSFLLDLGNPGAGGGKFEAQAHCSVNSLAIPWINPPIGSWYFWVISINGNTTSMYINGTFIGNNNDFTNPTNVSGKYLYFGCNVSPDGMNPYSDSYAPFFEGKIDDIRIYNRALNQTEITALYNEPNPSIASAVPTLSQWGIIILALLLLVIGTMFVWKRQNAIHKHLIH
jgi:trimeric autotransporter adhesin